MCCFSFSERLQDVFYVLVFLRRLSDVLLFKVFFIHRPKYFVDPPSSLVLLNRWNILLSYEKQCTLKKL